MFCVSCFVFKVVGVLHVPLSKSLTNTRDHKRIRAANGELSSSSVH